MTEGSSADGVDRAALHTFMERVRATLGHDLRTPLGTIVNYATVLEMGTGLDEEELRDLPRRIRAQAMQSAEMLELLLDATLLAASVPAFTPVDPSALLQSIVADLERDASRREPIPPPAPPAHAAHGPDTVELEPEIVRFAWRAFLLLDRSASSHPPSAAHTTVERRSDRVRLGLTVRRPTSRPQGNDGAAPVDLDAFTRGGEVTAPETHRLALRLSRELVAARSGELELCGRVGADAAIYISFPRSS